VDFHHQVQRSPSNLEGEIDYEIPQKGKPATLRLYNLRKWFRKMAHQAGTEIVQHWMGHVVKTGADESYRPRDVEFHRQLYKEKAMPFLRLETATPTETEKTITELKRQLTERDKEINAMKKTMTKIQPLVEFVNSFDHPENLKKILDYLKDDYISQSSDEKLYPLKIEFSPYISDKLNDIAERKGITRKEALEQLVEEDLEMLEKGEEEFKKLEKRAKKDTEEAKQ